jgi:hypothetical protein
MFPSPTPTPALTSVFLATSGTASALLPISGVLVVVAILLLLGLAGGIWEITIKAISK